MATATVTIYAKNLLIKTPDGITTYYTYDLTNGGPVMFQFSSIGRNVKVRTSDQRRPVLSEETDIDDDFTVTLRDVSRAIIDSVNLVVNTKYRLDFNLIGKAAAIPRTLNNAIFRGIQSADQARAQAGSCVLTFTHESADGYAAAFA